MQAVRRTLLYFSFLLFPITFIYFSPYLAVDGTREGVVSAGLITWLAVTVSAVIVNRGFCGWACPLGGLQEALPAALGKPLRQPKWGRASKYTIWAMWVGSIAVIASMVGGYRKVDIWFHNPGFPPYSDLAHYAFLFFVLLTAIPALFLGRRAFCHYLCFFSPLNILGSRLGYALRLPMLRVRVVEQSKCTQCKRCNRECPMSLDVSGMVARGAVKNRECIACGNCSAVCPAGTLGYGFGR